jgi:hypothetical protein
MGLRIRLAERFHHTMTTVAKVIYVLRPGEQGHCATVGTKMMACSHRLPFSAQMLGEPSCEGSSRGFDDPYHNEDTQIGSIS